MLPRALGEASAAMADGMPVGEAIDRARATLEKAGFEIDYVTLVDERLQAVDTVCGNDRLLAAARIGTTRLIDNLPVTKAA